MRHPAIPSLSRRPRLESSQLNMPSPVDGCDGGEGTPSRAHLPPLVGQGEGFLLRAPAGPLRQANQACNGSLRVVRTSSGELCEAAGHRATVFRALW